tara:strand:+ start:1656 stop:2405 length:750 start_codon:yes stop_codon:yes gene_type:complete
MRLYKGDCLEVMKEIESGSIDAIITDPPYGTTACKWDSVIDFDLMWEQLNRIVKPNGAIVLFGSEPFSSALRMSNIKNYKYDWIWEKDKAGNFALANRMPMKYHEIISVFYKKQPTYNKQRIERSEGGKKRNKTSNNFNNNNVTSVINGNLSSKSLGEVFYPKLKNPSSVLKYNKQVGLHPTQKPVPLMEYLIKTYTNENETVLDFTMGSGSTGVACVNTNRSFIGIEMDDKYFEIAEQRIKEANYKLF